MNAQMPDVSTLKDTLVISGQDWDRINKQLYRRKLEQERIEAIREEKEARKALSKDMVRDWPNTLEVCTPITLFVDLIYRILECCRQANSKRA